MKKLSDKTKGTLIIVFDVMISFTIINLINGYGKDKWYMYLLSLVIFPLITCGIAEIIHYKIKKDYEKTI